MLKIGDIYDNTPTGKTLRGPSRILGMLADRNVAILIGLPQRKKNKPTQTVDYVSGPYEIPISTMSAEESHKNIYKLNQPAISITDEDLLNQAKTEIEIARVKIELQRRDARYDVIWPLIRTGEKEELTRSALEMVLDRQLGQAITNRARELGIARTTVYNLIHRFWAGGSTKNALFTNYVNCGNPGQAKAQNKKLGRHSRIFKAGIEDNAGYALDQYKGPLAHEDAFSDKQKLAWGYRLIKHGTRPKAAYYTICSIFWAEHLVKADGTKEVILFPRKDRPTYNQFLRWGRMLNENRSITEVLLGTRKWKQKTEARGGSVQDQVTAVGQLAVFDGTSTDTYLVSVLDRLKKLPPMTRLVIKDVRTDVILGLYCGWSAPSSRTALQAILHAATSKVEYCKRFGITITEDQWPAMLCRVFLADNGELKSEKITEAESQFGFGVRYTPARQGDKKGGIETQHHIDHKHLDETVPGNTAGGTRCAPGEPHPAELALWNYFEYMRELIEHIVEHNSIEEVPDLAPIEMLANNPSIKPTRANIFKWLRERMSAEIPCDTDKLRAFMLPNHEAVIHKNGVYLVKKLLGYKHVIPRFRFAGEALVQTGLMSEVKRTGRVIPTYIKLDSENPSTAWLPTKKGLISLTLQDNDSIVRQKMTLTEWIEYIQGRILARAQDAGEADQFQASKVLRRLAVTETAKKELRTEIDKLAKKPSKASKKANLKENTVHEEKALSKMQNASEAEPVEKISNVSHQESVNDDDYNFAASVMERFNQKESDKDGHS